MTWREIVRELQIGAPHRSDTVRRAYPSDLVSAWASIQPHLLHVLRCRKMNHGPEGDFNFYYRKMAENRGRDT